MPLVRVSILIFVAILTLGSLTGCGDVGLRGSADSRGLAGLTFLPFSTVGDADIGTPTMYTIPASMLILVASKITVEKVGSTDIDELIVDLKEIQSKDWVQFAKIVSVSDSDSLQDLIVSSYGAPSIITVTSTLSADDDDDDSADKGIPEKDYIIEAAEKMDKSIETYDDQYLLVGVDILSVVQGESSQLCLQLSYYGKQLSEDCIGIYVDGTGLKTVYTGATAEELTKDLQDLASSGSITLSPSTDEVPIKKSGSGSSDDSGSSSSDSGGQASHGHGAGDSGYASDSGDEDDDDDGGSGGAAILDAGPGGVFKPGGGKSPITVKKQ